MGDQSRKMTLLLVNERALSRKYTLVLESEKHLRRENERLNQDIVRLERAVTERIGYLQRHKVGRAYMYYITCSTYTQSLGDTCSKWGRRNVNYIHVQCHEIHIPSPVYMYMYNHPPEAHTHTHTHHTCTHTHAHTPGNISIPTLQSPDAII